MKQLKDGHEFLELEHGLALVGLQHVAEGRDAGAAVLDAFPITQRLKPKLKVELERA